MKKTVDGSIIDDNGRVVYFSIERFLRDICYNDFCFICGASPDSVEFNNEHVIPDWLLKKHQLYDRKLILPNGHVTTYSRNKIPCCKNCNTLLGREIENPVQRLFAAEYDEFADQIINTNAVGLLFRWLCLVVFKTHYRDRSIRWNPDQRTPKYQIGDRYDWDELHHIHAVARSVYSSSKISPEVIGSLLVFPMDKNEREEEFDFVDLYPAQTVLLQSGSIGLIAVLNDSGGANIGFEPISERINGRLSGIQLREVLAHVSIINMHIKQRPEYSTFADLSSDQSFIRAEIPEKFELENHGDEEFGEVLHFTCGGLVRQSRTPNKEELLSRIKSGKYTFLFDKDGSFKKDSYRKLPLTD